MGLAFVFTSSTDESSSFVIVTLHLPLRGRNRNAEDAGGGHGDGEDVGSDRCKSQQLRPCRDEELQQFPDSVLFCATTLSFASDPA